jgi:hypothetical protein
MSQLVKKPGIINTRLHGILDYSSAFILLLPWITGFYESGNDTLIFTLLGVATIVFSILTDYEFGLIKLLPMKVHLIFDTLSALFLIAMPWLFPVSHYQYYWPTLLGITELLVVILSSSQPYRVNVSETQIGKP